MWLWRGGGGERERERAREGQGSTSFPLSPTCPFLPSHVVPPPTSPSTTPLSFVPCFLTAALAIRNINMHVCMCSIACMSVCVHTRRVVYKLVRRYTRGQVCVARAYVHRCAALHCAWRVHMCTHTHTYIYTYIHIYIYIYIYIYIIFLYIYIYIYTHTHTHTHTHIYIYIYRHTYICTHIYTYT
jgi:hypothetical protein